MAEKQGKSEKREGQVTRWDPFAELEAMESWPAFRGLLGPRGRLSRLLEGVLPETARGQGMFGPAMDIHENDKQYVVTVEVPGGKKDDVTVEVQEGVLSIRGEKKSEREEKREQRRWVERAYGAFTRSFTLPADADADHIDASLENGVLTVTIPRTESAKPRAVRVR